VSRLVRDHAPNKISGGAFALPLFCFSFEHDPEIRFSLATNA
jgi:hypothetical protein